MLKFIKLLTGILMAPLAYVLTGLFLQLLQSHAEGRAGTEALWFWGGFITWLVLFILFPRPMRTYILAHELTHALWGMLMGARVSRLRVSERGGSVTLNKSNLLITLAPYFFPFYSALALLAYGITGIWWDTSQYTPLWYALFGLTWSFHLTFTVAILGVKQPDIQEQGRVFSYVFIYCINIATATALLKFLAGITWADLGQGLASRTLQAYQACYVHANAVAISSAQLLGEFVK